MYFVAWFWTGNLLLSWCSSASDGVKPFWSLGGDAFGLPVTLVLMPDIIIPAQSE